MKRKRSIMALIALTIVSMTAISGAYALRTQAFNTDAQQALADGNYNNFLTAIEKPQITQAQFQTMSDRYNAKQALQAAINSKDYNSWLTAEKKLEAPRLSELITTANFDKFVQMQTAIKSGDYQTAKTLATELGITKAEMGFGPMAGKMGMHGHMGWR